jgi:hypothetical protein
MKRKTMSSRRKSKGKKRGAMKRIRRQSKSKSGMRKRLALLRRNLSLLERKRNRRISLKMKEWLAVRGQVALRRRRPLLKMSSARSKDFIRRSSQKQRYIISQRGY